MAVLKLMLDKRNKGANEFPLAIRVSHKQKTKYIFTGYKLKEKEWDEKDNKVIKPYANCGRANARIQAKLAIASLVIESNQEFFKNQNVFEVVKNIEAEIDIKINGKKDEPLNNTLIKRTELFEYSKEIIKSLKLAKRIGYSLSIEAGVNSFKTYASTILKKDKLFFNELNLNLIKHYVSFCQNKKMEINSYGGYLRSIRMIFNTAIKDPLTEVNETMYPFGRNGYSIKTGRPIKRAVKEEVIDVLRKADLEEGTPIWHSRNYFLLEFNL